MVYEHDIVPWNKVVTEKEGLQYILIDILKLKSHINDNNNNKNNLTIEMAYRWCCHKNKTTPSSSSLYFVSLQLGMPSVIKYSLVNCPL